MNDDSQKKGDELGQYDDEKLTGLELTLGALKRNILGGEAPYYAHVPLHFECTRCGECCRRPGSVFLEPEDIARMAPALKMSEEEVIDTYVDREPDGKMLIRVKRNRPCPFFEDPGCKLHPHKPTQCRTYPFWPEFVTDFEDWVEEASACEGIGEGRAYRGQEVEAMLVGRFQTVNNE